MTPEEMDQWGQNMVNKAQAVLLRDGTVPALVVGYITKAPTDGALLPEPQPLFLARHESVPADKFIEIVWNTNQRCRAECAFFAADESPGHVWCCYQRHGLTVCYRVTNVAIVELERSTENLLGVEIDTQLMS